VSSLTAAAGLQDAAGAASTATTISPAAFKAALKTVCTPHPLAKSATLTLAWAGPFEVWAPVTLAQKFGEFAKENLTVTTTVQQAPNAVVLLQGGQVDLNLTGFAAGQFNAIVAGGTTFKFVAEGTTLDPSTNGFYVADKYYKNGKLDVASFKGTTISLTPGAPGDAISPFLDVGLRKQYKIGLSDFHVVANTSNNNLISLQNGAVSAAYLSPPYSTQAVNAGLVKSPIWAIDKPLTAYIASADALATKKPALTAFFRAIECTIGTYLQGDYHQNSQVVDALASALGAPASTINNGPAPYRWPVNLRLDPAPFQQIQAGWIKFGQILSYSKPLSARKLIDGSVLPPVPSVFRPL